MSHRWVLSMGKLVGATALAVSGLFALQELPAAAATTLSFSTQPGNATINTAFNSQPAVTVTSGTATASITLSITSGTGTTGAVLTCTTNPLAASSSVATFSGCSINLPGVGYTLTATDNTDSGVTTTSSAFNVVGTPSRLAFITQPTGTVAGFPLPTQPVVAIEDSAGNIVTTDANPVSISTSVGAGPTGAAIACVANTVTPVSGVATYSGCVIRAASTFYTLTAIDSVDSLTALSSAFAIVPAAAVSLVFTIQPGNGVLGAALASQPTVTIEDIYGNPEINDTSPISLAITGAGATLSCATNPITPLSGVASFSGCSVNATGTYTLTAADPLEALGATSSGFTVSTGTTTLALSSNAASPLSAGSTVIYTATVTRSAGSAALSGKVAFANGGTAITGCTSLALTAGAATCSIAFNSAGTSTITATYANDPSYAGSSASLTQIVKKPTPKLALRPSSLRVALGKTLSVRIGVTGSLSKPTGVVVVSFGHHALCSARLVRGTASCTISTRYLTRGRDHLSIRYAGSTTYAAMTDTAIITVT